MAYTYEEIENANNKTKTIDIKGKEYTEVNQRTKAFRMVNPLGTIETYQTRLDGEMGNRVVEWD